MNNAATFEDAVTQIARELSLPRRFLADLRQEDDWSFVVKSHALAESALTHLLATRLGHPDTARARGAHWDVPQVSSIRPLKRFREAHERTPTPVGDSQWVVHDGPGCFVHLASYPCRDSTAVRFGKVFREKISPRRILTP